MTRGEIWWADFGLPFGSETGFERPVLIIQSDSFNRSNINTTIIVPLTTNLRLADAPGNVFIDKVESGLPKDSVVNVSLPAAIDKKRLKKMSRRISETIIAEVEKGVLLVLGIH